MPEVTATMVKALRERTGLPLMEVKKALQETGGDEEKALEFIRKQGIKTKETRIGRETSAGRVAVYVDFAKGVGAMVELQCESAPVAGGKEFIQFANDLAKHLATGPGAGGGEELLKQTMPGKSQTFGEALDDMYNRIREVFKLGRVARIDGACGGYAHHDGSAGALVEVQGGNAETAKDIAMHVVAFKPAAVSKDDLDPAAVEKEREILTAAARQEGKPENIIGKMIEGRLKNFFAERVLLEQPFVKDDKRTVGKVAEEAKMKVVRFVRWELGKE
ncbi:MAG TPA: translation elongation factor Ts [Pirellulales bacterium]